jgi:hypothetical protein
VVVLAQRREDYLHVWDRMLDDGTLCPRERLTRFMDYLAETQEHRMEKGGCPFGNLVAEMAGHSERFRCQLSELFVGLTGRLSALIAEGQRSGAFRRDLDAHEAAYLVIQATQGMLLMTKCNRTVDNLNRGGRLLIHLISAA